MMIQKKTKTKVVKRWHLFFLFPKAKSAHAQQMASVDAPDLGKAVQLGWKAIKTRQGIKGARLSEGKISFTVETISTKL